MKPLKNKNNKKTGPEVTNMDVLALMSDEELDNLEKRLILERESVLASSNGDARLWEEELCYVQREKEIRNVRKMRHNVWYGEYRQQFEYFVDDAIVN